MSQFFQIHPENPQGRLIYQAVEMIKQGAVVVLPTDSGYAIGCHLQDKAAKDKIKQTRRLDDKHNFTLLVRDLSELATYAKVENHQYRFLKSHTPGAYTFILPGTKEVPKRLLNERRKTIGIRVPENNITLALLEELGEPLMSVSLILPEETEVQYDPYEIRQVLEKQVDLIIDGGYCGMKSTTVIDMSSDEMSVARAGAAPIPEGLSI